MAEQTNRLVCIEVSDLFPFDVVECRGGALPRLDPFFTEQSAQESSQRVLKDFSCDDLAFDWRVNTGSYK